jgi:hypothetical protein
VLLLEGSKNIISNDNSSILIQDCKTPISVPTTLIINSYNKGEEYEQHQQQQ